jgi:hypothetical protein
LLKNEKNWQTFKRNKKLKEKKRKEKTLIIITSSLGTVLGTTHIHSTRLAGVRGWAKS